MPSVLVFLSVAVLGLQQAPPGQDLQVTRLEDVVVEGRPLEELVADFVADAGVPARGRGLARWQDDVCVGVVNLRAEVAQYLVDRVSEVAMELGVTPGDPGCRANIIVIFTDDAGALAARLADEHRRAFRSGTGGLDRGEVAFADFVSSDAPVRWWHVSMPVDAETGARAVRLPGDMDPSSGKPAAPTISVFAASRLNSQLRDDMRKAMVIVDVDGVAGVEPRQLADYIALVSLAQVDPGADFGGYDTILRLFDAPEAAPAGLTAWDRSYLHNLYRALDDPQRRRNPDAATAAVAGAMIRDRRASSAQEPDED